MKRTKIFRFLVSSRFLLAGLTLIGAAAPELYGTSFLVTTKDDTEPGKGICPGPSCSLRAAVEQASNAAAPEALITLPAGTYKLSQGPLTITGTAKNFVLSGAGSDSTIIDGGGAPVPDVSSGSQVFEISIETVHFYGVTIQNGQGFSGGGGILIDKGSTLVLGNSVVRSNESSQSGAGISNNGFLQIFNCTIEKNAIIGFFDTPAGGGEASRGGGIFNAVGAKVEIDSSTISDNKANRGGGIDNSGFLEISNSTISGNLVNGGGGGIRNKATGNVSIVFSTIADNVAGINGTGQNPITFPHPRAGGGILNFGTIAMSDTILALNRQGSNDHPIDSRFTDYSPDCFSSSADPAAKATFLSYRRNLVGVVNQNCNLEDYLYGMETVEQPFFDKLGSSQDIHNSGFLSPGLVFFQSHEQGIDIQIPVLADNGGQGTKTHALLPGSPAIDFAGQRNCPETDERGALRPAGMRCDTGAFELGNPDDITTKVKITPGGFSYNRVTKQMKQTITLRNTTANRITTQVFLVLDNLNLPLANKDGTSVPRGQPPKSSPYLTVVCNLSLSECLHALPPGEDKSFTLIFDDPSAQRPQYTTRVIAGAGLP